MATDENSRPDDVVVSLNDEGTESEGNGRRVELASIRPRPAHGAPKASWVDYCVDLGADRSYLTSDTEHVSHSLSVDEDANEVRTPVVDHAGQPVMETHHALSKDALIDLADRLEG